MRIPHLILFMLLWGLGGAPWNGAAPTAWATPPESPSTADCVRQLLEVVKFFDSALGGREKRKKLNSELIDALVREAGRSPGADRVRRLHREIGLAYHSTPGQDAEAVQRLLDELPEAQKVLVGLGPLNARGLQEAFGKKSALKGALRAFGPNLKQLRKFLDLLKPDDTSGTSELDAARQAAMLFARIWQETGDTQRLEAFIKRYGGERELARAIWSAGPETFWQDHQTAPLREMQVKAVLAQAAPELTSYSKGLASTQDPLISRRLMAFLMKKGRDQHGAQKVLLGAGTEIPAEVRDSALARSRATGEPYEQALIRSMVQHRPEGAPEIRLDEGARDRTALELELNAGSERPLRIAVDEKTLNHVLVGHHAAYFSFADWASSARIEGSLPLWPSTMSRQQVLDHIELCLHMLTIKSIRSAQRTAYGTYALNVGFNTPEGRWEYSLKVRPPEHEGDPWKMTQFFPRSGPGLRDVSPSDIKALAQELHGDPAHAFRFQSGARGPIPLEALLAK